MSCQEFVIKTFWTIPDGSCDILYVMVRLRTLRLWHSSSGREAGRGSSTGRAGLKVDVSDLSEPTDTSGPGAGVDGGDPFNVTLVMKWDSMKLCRNLLTLLRWQTSFKDT